MNDGWLTAGAAVKRASTDLVVLFSTIGLSQMKAWYVCIVTLVNWYLEAAESFTNSSSSTELVSLLRMIIRFVIRL
jgi:hypothetical protein